MSRYLWYAFGTRVLWSMRVAFSAFFRRYWYLSVAWRPRRVLISRTLMIPTLPSFALCLNAPALTMLMRGGIEIGVGEYFGDWEHTECFGFTRDTGDDSCTRKATGDV